MREVEKTWGGKKQRDRREGEGEPATAYDSVRPAGSVFLPIIAYTHKVLQP